MTLTPKEDARHPNPSPERAGLYDAGASISLGICGLI